MVTAVGLTAPASCAAIRAGISRVQEVPFMIGDEDLMGAIVPIDEPLGSWDKLLRMTIMAVGECLDALGPERERVGPIPIVLCLPEPTRAGRVDKLDGRFLSALRHHLELDLREPLANPPALVTAGRAGGVEAVATASQLITSGAEVCIVAGVDTLLTAETLTAYHEQERLKTEENSNGFIPGEAAAAVLLRKPSAGQGALYCRGTGMALEPAPLGSGEPSRAEGIFHAVRDALKGSGCSETDLSYRITDTNGEHYSFKEASLAATRTLRTSRDSFPLWHPVHCIGDVGAAIVPLVLGVAHAAVTREYAPGPGVLCHFSSDGAERGALVLSSSSGA